MFDVDDANRRHLLGTQRDEQARAVIAELNSVPIDSDVVEAHVAELAEAIKAENEGGHATWAECFSTRNALWKRTGNGMMLQFIQQLNGQNFYCAYSTRGDLIYLWKPMLTPSDKITMGTRFSKAQVLSKSCLAGSYASLDPLQALPVCDTNHSWSCFGRRNHPRAHPHRNVGSASRTYSYTSVISARKLTPPQSLLTGALWEAVCAIIAGLVGHYTLAPSGTPAADLTQRNKNGGDTLIAFAVLHVFGFSMFWGPTPWVYLGESFPLRVRAKCIALGSASSASSPLRSNVRLDFGCADVDEDSRLDMELFVVVLCPAYRR